MNERGFTPMAAAALIMLAVAVAFAFRIAGAGTGETRAEALSMHELFLTGAAVRNQIDAALRYSAYRALEEVSREAWRRDAPERIRMVETMTGIYFGEALRCLPEVIRDPRVELRIAAGPPHVRVDEAAGTGVLVHALLPASTELRLKARDGSASVTLPLDGISVDLDSRYFLLEDLMENFTDGMGDVNTYWGVAEYLASWLEAWTTGCVDLTKTAALFEAAWCLHEFNTFGSADLAAPLLHGLEGVLTSGQASGAGLPDRVEDLKRWIESSREMVRSSIKRITDITGMLEGAGGDNRIDLESVAEELCGMRDELARAKGALSNILASLSPDGFYPPNQALTGLDGMMERIENVIDIVREAGRSDNREIAEDAIRVLAELATVSGTVGHVQLSDPLGGTQTVPVFISSADDATFPRLLSVLDGMSSEMGRLRDLVPPDASAFRELLSVSRTDLIPGRREFLSVFPPEPLKDEPGVSVFHRMTIGKIEHRREDPAGLIGAEMATPVPLWFIGVTVWWGQWETVIRLKECRESIFDFKNKVIPALTELGGVHVPLEYGWLFTENEFRMRVVIVSLKPFIVKSGCLLSPPPD